MAAGYPDAEAVFADADARIALATALMSRFAPIARTPAETYLIKTRRIPEAAVHGCQDLRHLPSPIDGRPPQDHALVSLIRDAEGEVGGFQLEFVNISGARTGTEPTKLTFALREHGVRDGLFRAGGEGDTAYICEGYSCKTLAIASLGLGKVYGGGARTVLGCAAPPEPTVILVPDRQPDATVVDIKTKRSAADNHDRDMRRAVDLLTIAGKTVLLAKAPDCTHPGGGTCKDADDVLRVHGPVRLRELLEAAEPTALSLDGEARKLAQIDDPLERDAQTKVKAAELKVRVALLRDRVAHYRDAGRTGATPGDDAPGKRIEFDKLEMHDSPVVGSELLDDLAAAIRRHAFIDECDVIKSVLWTIHGHRRFHHNAQVLPRLVVTASREDSGKTTLAVVLAHASDVALVVVSPRAATLFRMIEAHQAALFLDEADTWYPRNEDLREIVNSGFNKDGALVPRTEDVGTGGKCEREVRLYSTFAPMAIIGINLEKILARTLLSRALIIRMTPARVGEATADIFANPPAVRALRDIASRAKRWVADNEGKLVAAKPELPGVINRLRLVWDPLVAIADLGGGDWPVRARAALETERGRARDPNLGEQLLLDARQVMVQASVPGLHTKDLIEKLLPLEMRPWSAYGRRQIAIRDIDVAELLVPYGLKPRQLKIRGLNRNGYKLVDIEGAIERYIHTCDQDPAEDLYPSTSPEKPQDTAGFEVDPEVEGRGDGSTAELEVGSTTELDSTDFPEQNQRGRGVDPSSAPSLEHTCHPADGGAASPTITLECADCGTAFEHDRHARGRRPKTCPKCRGSGARERAAVVDEVPPETDRIVDQVFAAQRCGHCGAAFRPGEAAVEIAGKHYHDDDACAGTVRRRMGTA